MDDSIGGLKAKAEEMGMAKVKEEADKRGLGGLVDQAAGFLHLGGQPAASKAETPAEAASEAEAPAEAASEAEVPAEEASAEEASSDSDEPAAEEEN